MNSDPLKLGRFSGAAHALLRIMAALSYISHGTMKLCGFPAMPAMPGAPAMPAPPLFSLFGAAGLLEIVGGGLVLIGLFTRPAAFLLAGEMAIAYWLVHARGGLIPVTNMGEAAYLYCFIFLWLSAAGAGPWSLDASSHKG
jgi:putative oxidoreductase